MGGFFCVCVAISHKGAELGYRLLRNTKNVKL